MENSSHPFAALTPDTVLGAIESIGLQPDLCIYPLNSYENRVYYVGLDNAQPVIAKFYRPARWTDAQILEEHAFTQELVDHELSVINACQFQEKTLFNYEAFRFALYPRQGGYAPDLDNSDTLLVLGRALGRIHAIGATQIFTHRKILTIEEWGFDNYHYILANNFIPADLLPAYKTTVEDLLKKISQLWESLPAIKTIRLHGDCHPGNILWRDDVPHFVDFDDCCMGPAIQDLWMLLSGDRQQRSLQISDLIEGYNEFYDFNPQELVLVEVLRTLRIIHYSAWLARRCDDPAFVLAFPWFNTPRYWAEHILELREQLSELQEPPLVIY